MTDDAFHLTSHDVRAQEFQRSLRGYDTTQVDEFKQRMAEEIDRLVRERVQLDERVKGMSEQLRSYRDRERAMNDALVSAQQLRGEAQVQADREREICLREAQTEADRILLETRTEVAGSAEDAFEMFRQMLERQLHEVEALGVESSSASDQASEQAYQRQKK